MIDTAGTFCNAIEALKNAGAKDVYGACTHPILSGPAVERLEKSELKTVYVTDSIQLNHNHAQSKKVKVLSVAQLFAEAIKRAFAHQSISSLFDVDKG